VKQLLSELTDGSTLNEKICGLLAQEPKTAAAVFRASGEVVSSLKTPIVLAYHFGRCLEEARSEADHVGHPSHLAFRVSHRLLEAVCQKGQALMSKTIFTCDTEATVSLIDEHSPRALMCVPLGTHHQMMDVLYVDIPIEDGFQPGPEEMFAFVQAVAMQVQDRAVDTDISVKPR
jgi:transcriptional regulator with GAF, ATPase, and Fis domain